MSRHTITDTLSREHREVVTSPKDLVEVNTDWHIFMPWKNINVYWEIRLYHDYLVYQMTTQPIHFTMSALSKRFTKHINKVLWGKDDTN
jgi:hypothetical protein